MSQKTVERKIMQFNSIILDLIDEFVKSFYKLDTSEDPRDFYDVSFVIDHKYFPWTLDLQQWEFYFSIPEIYETMLHWFSNEILIERNDFDLECYRFWIDKKINYYNFAMYEELRENAKARLEKVKEDYYEIDLWFNYTKWVDK